LPEFIGRDAELATLTAALDKDSGATVVVTAVQGMGGVGKTTLAQHAARRLADRYSDGQIVVDLNGHGVGAPTAPLDAMMQVIRAFHPATPALTDVAQARAIYRDTLNGKKVLILLDNAADTDQVRDLIPPPLCAALITARTLVQPAGRPTLLTLGLLSQDDSVALLRTLAPDAVGTAAEWIRLAELCGCLPLALRVAGSTLAAADDLTLPEYLAELADEATRPHRLTIDGDASANVAAVLTHSLRRLIDQDSALAARWQSLSIIPADFDRAAAAALWEIPEANAAPTLRALRNHSLLLHDEATRRHRLHDLMRPLARSLFAAAEDPEPGAPARLATAQGRFALHIMAVLAEADDLYLRDQGGVAAGLARYDADARNIAAAAAWAIAHADHDPAAQQVAAEATSVLPPTTSAIWATPTSLWARHGAPSSITNRPSSSRGRSGIYVEKEAASTIWATPTSLWARHGAPSSITNRPSSYCGKSEIGAAWVASSAIWASPTPLWAKYGAPSSITNRPSSSRGRSGIGAARETT
jgi:hypothetical protein